MPELIGYNQRVGSFRGQISPQTPSSFFTTDIRAKINEAQQSQQIAAGDARAANERARVFEQAAQTATNIGTLAYNIEVEDAVNINKSKKRDFDVGMINLHKYYANPNVKATYKDKIKEYAEDYEKNVADLRAVYDEGVKDVPAFIRNDFDIAIDLDSTEANLRISLQQAQMVQDASAANLREDIQLDLLELKEREDSLESTQKDIKTRYAWGIRRGILPNNEQTQRALFRDLEEAERIDANNEVDAELAEANAFAKKLIVAQVADTMDYPAAVKAVATSDLSGPQKREVLSQLNIYRTAELERRKVESAKERATIFGRLADEVLPDRAEILAIGKNLSPEQQQQFVNWSLDIAAKRAKGEISRYEEGDPRVRAHQLRKIDLTPNAISVKQIHELVGNGLSVKDAEDLVGYYDRRTATGAKPVPQVVKDARATLSDIYEVKKNSIAQMSDKDPLKLERSRQAAIEHLLHRQALDQYIEDNPEALNNPQMLSDWINNQTKFSLQDPDLSGGYFGYALEGARRTEAIIEQFRTSGQWDNWTTEQQDLARAEADRGQTLNAIIDTVNKRSLQRRFGEGAKSIVEGSEPAPANQKNTDKNSALRGELGTLNRPDGGVSSEISVTVQDERLNEGKPTNIPLMIKKQVGVDDLLADKKATKEQVNRAIERAAVRVKNGETLPSYETIKEAVAAAKKRSQSKNAKNLPKPKKPTASDPVGVLD